MKKSIERKNRTAQTRLQVYPYIIDEGDFVKVVTNLGNQTIISIPIDADNNSIYSILEYLPFREIEKNYIREIELPRKNKLIWALETDGELSAYISRMQTDTDAQTSLTVSPHVLEDDEVAKVYTDLRIQTSITFTPDTSLTIVLAKLKENLDHLETRSSSSLEEALETSSEIDNEKIKEIENRIIYILENTVVNLEDKLNNIVKLYGENLNEVLEENVNPEEETTENIEETEEVFETNEEVEVAPTSHLEPIISEPEIFKEGYVHGFTQTDNVVFHCTGTNYDCGDENVIRFTSEGVGTMEMACQCMDKVHVSTQDGLVETEALNSTNVPIGDGDQSLLDEDSNLCTCERSSISFNEIDLLQNTHKYSREPSIESCTIPCKCPSQEEDVGNTMSSEPEIASSMKEQPQPEDQTFVSLITSDDKTDETTFEPEIALSMKVESNCACDETGKIEFKPPVTSTMNEQSEPEDQTFVSLISSSEKTDEIMNEQSKCTCAEMDQMIFKPKIASATKECTCICTCKASALEGIVSPTNGDKTNEITVEPPASSTMRQERETDEMTFEPPASSTMEQELQADEMTFEPPASSTVVKEPKPEDQTNYSLGSVTGDSIISNDESRLAEIQEVISDPSAFQELVYAAPPDKGIEECVCNEDESEHILEKLSVDDENESFECSCDEETSDDESFLCDCNESKSDLEKEANSDDIVICDSCLTSDQSVQKQSVDENSFVVCECVPEDNPSCLQLDVSPSEDKKPVNISSEQQTCFPNGQLRNSSILLQNIDYKSECICDDEVNPKATQQQTSFANTTDNSAFTLVSQDNNVDSTIETTQQQTITTSEDPTTLANVINKGDDILEHTTPHSDQRISFAAEDSLIQVSITETNRSACDCSDTNESTNKRYAAAVIEFDQNVKSLFIEKVESDQSFVCDCDSTDDFTIMQKKSSFVTCDDEDCHITKDSLLTIDKELSALQEASQNEAVREEFIPIGDYADNKRSLHILCECMPNISGAAPPAFFEKGQESIPEIGAQAQSLERLCNENPSNLEAFMQRLRTMSSTKEGKEYIRDLRPDTVEFLIKNGYEDELKRMMLLAAPSHYLFQADPIYIESYMAGLELDSSSETVKSDYSLVDTSDVGECNNNNVEMPWFKITLPQVGTYQIKSEQPQDEVFMSTVFDEGEPPIETNMGEEKGDKEEDETADDEKEDETADDEKEDETADDEKDDEKQDDEKEEDEKEIVESNLDEEAPSDVEGKSEDEDKPDEGEIQPVEEGDEETHKEEIIGDSIEKDCEETYHKKFRLLVDNPYIYYHEPQYEELRLQYESEEEDDCEEELILPWKYLALRTNATIIQEKNVTLLPATTASTSTITKENEECLCDICPDIPPPQTQPTDSCEEFVECKCEEPKPPPSKATEEDEECVCDICPDIPQSQAQPTVEEFVDCKCEEPKPAPPITKTCAANVPPPPTCNLDNKLTEEDEECVCDIFPDIPQSQAQPTVEESEDCICEESKPAPPKTKTCAADVPHSQTCDLADILKPPPGCDLCTCTSSLTEQAPPPQKTVISTSPAPKKITQELMSNSSCSCDEKKIDEPPMKIKKTYCARHSCRELNAAGGEIKKKTYLEDDCDCTPDMKPKMSKKSCVQCNTKSQQTKSQQSNQGSEKTQSTHIATIPCDLSMTPVNTKSLIDSSVRKPITITVRTVSMPSMAKRRNIIKTIIKGPQTMKDFQCQCCPFSTSKLKDVCTETLTDVKLSSKCACNSKFSIRNDPVLAALAAYQAEMKPIKETLFQLREKIRDLNLSEAKAFYDHSSKSKLNELYKSSFQKTPSDSPSSVSSRTHTSDNSAARNANLKRNPQQLPFKPIPPPPLPSYQHPGFMPGYNPTVPPYYSGMYPNYSSNLRFPNYQLPHYGIPPPDFRNFNCNQFKSKQTETLMQNISNVNEDFPKVSTTSLKTTMTQTKSKKRDRKKRKPNVPISSSDASDCNVLNVISSNQFPVKEERQSDKNIKFKYGVSSENHTDFGPGIIDVQASENGGRYNLKIALKMKPAESKSKIPSEVSSILKKRSESNEISSPIELENLNISEHE